MSYITYNLWIGGEDDAEDAHFLRRKNITSVVNCAAEIDDMKRYPGVSYIHLPLRDQHDQCILKLIDKGRAFMRRHRNENILVNCAMGMSRSVSIALAHLVCDHGWRYQDALTFIQDRRNIASPNASFRRQLQYLAKNPGYKHCAQTCALCIARSKVKARRNVRQCGRRR